MSTEMEVELKAIEMLDKFGYGEDAKSSALIAVTEILELDVWDWPHNAKYGKLFWEEVKEKILTL